jgi:hypothetical protein
MKNLSRHTQNNIRMVIVNLKSISNFQKEYSKPWPEAGMPFDAFCRTISEKKQNGDDTLLKKTELCIGSMDAFQQQIREFIRDCRLLDKRMEVLNAMISKKKSEKEICACLPLLKSESTKLSIRAGALCASIIFCKWRMKGAVLTLRKSSFPNFSQNFPSHPQL